MFDLEIGKKECGVKYAISKLSFASVSKRVFVRNHPYENEFRLRIHCGANQTLRTRFQTEETGKRLICMKNSDIECSSVD